MTTEKRYETAAEAREQALSMIRRALRLDKGHMPTGFQRAIERAQEARVIEVLEALRLGQFRTSALLDEMLSECQRRLDALAEEVC